MPNRNDSQFAFSLRKNLELVGHMAQEQAKAAALRVLHSGREILLLPNAWDVASARVVEESGFKAVATSSAESLSRWAIPMGRRFRARRCWPRSLASPSCESAGDGGC